MRTESERLRREVDKLAKKGQSSTGSKEFCRKDDAEHSSGKQQQLSLDDIAVLLVQLEPSDLPGVVHVWQELGDIQKAVLPAAQAHISKAIEKLEEIIEDRSDDPGSTMSAAGSHLEEAMYALEEGYMEERGAPGCLDDHMPAGDERIGTGQNEIFVLPEDADLELLGDFITESRELIEGAEAALLSLENDPHDVQSVSTVFRAFHTIKGTSGFLGLALVSELAHKAESILSKMRDGELRCRGGYADLLLRSVDLLKELMQVVQDALGGEALAKPNDYDFLIDILADPQANGISEEQGVEIEMPRVGDILVARGKEREEVEDAAACKGEQLIGEALLKSETASVSEVAKALRAQKQMEGQPTESSVRICTDRLDRLIETVGELVIAQSMVVQDAAVAKSGNHELAKKVAHSGKIVRELQDLSMSMRMIPLRPTFQKMARIVRDVARKSGKRVNFVTEGEETEIDRNMVDIISDPLVHLVRNAVDHGIESPDIRAEKKKPREGVVSLLAYHSAGSVVVEIKDDGRGLDKAKIAKKAIAKGLIESDSMMSESEIFGLMFEPGFSTAEQVTEISGRGVGLDVVKKGIQALRGRVDISSEPGEGTTFSLRLPLTLAITDGMLVGVGEERYIIPTVNIHLSFRPTEDALSTVQERGEMVMLRGELMPLYRLHQLFDVEGAIEDPRQGLLVVMSDGEKRFALLVDELLSQQQVVAKSLGDGIGKIPGVFGGAILGDGNVGLILDPAELTTLAKDAAYLTEKEETMAGR